MAAQAGALVGDFHVPPRRIPHPFEIVRAILRGGVEIVPQRHIGYGYMTVQWIIPAFHIALTPKSDTFEAQVLDARA
ncbi:hypothetical protein [Sphingomonas glacialis]|uniref:Uncharacterized protein n=1 Tax=Sphingomonas glacialis TaxID=658225 RepID=A0A502FIW4_9SPHN|nr:hypothetical protein [Sphingomonas glacialis]TPG49447.1 hypothetical protein EAH76_19115 [Sphingomonas glacialis]